MKACAGGGAGINKECKLAYYLSGLIRGSGRTSEGSRMVPQPRRRRLTHLGGLPVTTTKQVLEARLGASVAPSP